jgi:hypothetical protein
VTLWLFLLPLNYFPYCSYLCSYHVYFPFFFNLLQRTFQLSFLAVKINRIFLNLILAIKINFFINRPFQQFMPYSRIKWFLIYYVLKLTFLTRDLDVFCYCSQFSLNVLWFPYVFPIFISFETFYTYSFTFYKVDLLLLIFLEFLILHTVNSLSLESWSALLNSFIIILNVYPY